MRGAADPVLEWCFQYRLGSALVLVAVHVLWLHGMGRPLLCECGIVEVWQRGTDPAANSQQLTDWYSLLHVVFGAGLYMGLAWLRPWWTPLEQSLVALASSTLWELVENTPWVIGLMNNAANAAPDYRGDSIVNSLADTGCVLIGFWLACRLPRAWTFVLALLFEAAVTLAIRDGLVLATVRIVRDLVR